MGFSWPHQGTNPSLLTAMGLTWWVEFKTWVMGEASEECSTPKKPKNVVETSLVSQRRATSQNLQTRVRWSWTRPKKDQTGPARPIQGLAKGQPQPDPHRPRSSRTRPSRTRMRPKSGPCTGPRGPSVSVQAVPTAECYTIHMQPFGSQDIKFLFLILFLWVYILCFQWGWAVMLIIGFSCVSLLYIAIRGYWP